MIYYKSDESRRKANKLTLLFKEKWKEDEMYSEPCSTMEAYSKMLVEYPEDFIKDMIGEEY